MGKELLMAVDLGTSFIKVGVFDLAGVSHAEAKEAVHDERPAPGIFIQRGEELVSSVIRCIRSAAEQLDQRVSDVQAIAFTGQMAGFMGVDKDWQDVTGWSCSMDTRYAPYAAHQLETMSHEFLELSGTNSPLFSAKYAWFRDAFPEEEKRIARYLMVSGYIIGKLGDISTEDAVIDGSLITWTGLADVKNRSWSEDICHKLAVRTERLPRIVQSTDVVARLSREAASLTGLCAGIPLVSGAGDKVAGCVGAANLKPGQVLYEAASFGGISFQVENFRVDREARHFDILNGAESGQLYAHYYMPGSGLTMDWFLNQFAGGHGGSLAERYRALDEQMTDIAPGSDGLMAIGMLSGTVMPFDPDLRGVWMGHTLSHSTAHFYRALGESFGYALSGALERMEAIYPEYQPERVRIIGGGARSEQMTQILADITGKSFETIDKDDLSLWGACILAAKGVGMVGDMAEFAASHVHMKRVFTPNPENVTIYRALKQQYQQYVRAMSPYCANLIR